MTLDALLFGLAVASGAAAALAGRPSPAALDAPLLFNLLLATFWRGELESSGGRRQDWEALLRDGLLFHPAGRQGWEKVLEPRACKPPVPALPGELALLEDLAALDGPRARMERMFFSREGLPVLMDDPALLGREYDPAHWLGAGCAWDSLASWDQVVVGVLARRFQHEHCLLVHDAAEAPLVDDLLAGLEGLLQGSPVLLDDVEPTRSRARELASHLLSWLDSRERRLILWALGDAGPLLLAALREAPALRDRVTAVIALGSPFGGVPGDPPPGLDQQTRSAWLHDEFTQENMDLELKRSVPYLLLQRLDPEAAEPGDGRIPWGQQVLREPPVPPSGRRPVRVADLGPVLGDGSLLPPAYLARAIILTLLALRTTQGRF